MVPLAQQKSLYIYILSVMSKEPSKLRKNHNNTDVSLYQIYLLKLQKNILKYNRLNLLQEITIGFNRAFQMASESLARLSGCLFD